MILINPFRSGNVRIAIWILTANNWVDEQGICYQASIVVKQQSNTTETRILTMFNLELREMWQYWRIFGTFQNDLAIW
jgi:hypothetical protein